MLSDGFRAAAESKDFSKLEELFAEDVTFRSPAVFKPYEGRDAVAMLLTAVAHVFEDFRYTDQVETGDVAALAFSATVGDRELDGIDLLRFDGEGKGATWPCTSVLSAACTRSPRRCSARSADSTAAI